MRENEFSFTNLDSYKELSIVLAKEFPQQIEDLLKLIFNVSASIVLLPRYLSYRYDLNT
jgi:hypothetical protein